MATGRGRAHVSPPRCRGDAAVVAAQQVKCCKSADEDEDDDDEDDGWGRWSGPPGRRHVLAPHLPRAPPEHHLLVQQVALWMGSPRER